MLTSLETGAGLDLVVWLQAGGNSLFDVLAQVFNAAGGDIFFMLVLAGIYWSIDRHLGLRMLLVLGLSAGLYTALKMLLQTPRPFDVSDAVRVLAETESYGLPSGHVASAVATWGYLALRLRRAGVTIAVVIYTLMMGWARMYAGVHYPQDVIGGVLVGLLVLVLFVWLEARFPSFWARLKLSAQIALLVIVALVVTVFLFDDQTGTTVAGILLGAGLGQLAEQRFVGFSSGGERRQRILRFAVGILFLLVVFFGLRLLFGALAADDSTMGNLLRIPRYALVAFSAVFVWPWLALRVGLVQNTVIPDNREIIGQGI